VYVFHKYYVYVFHKYYVYVFHKYYVYNERVPGSQTPSDGSCL